MSGSMYRQKPNMVAPKPTIYNTPKNITENEKQDEEKTSTQPQIKLLREAHVTEITLGSQTLRVMDAGHIQGVINMIEKHDSSIKQLNKTVNTMNRNIQLMHQQIQQLNTEIDNLKGKLNGNFL